MGKIKYWGLLIAGLAFLMSSCLERDNTTIDDWNLGNAQISAFSLSNDSIEGLSKVVFTIDQVNGKIYNRDSMPYGTVIEEKVLCSLSYEVGGALGVIFVSQATGDTVYWNGSDSVDFSSPVWITVYPYDGVSTKTYEARINIHQVDPDSMVWELHSGLVAGASFTEMKVLPYKDSYYMYVGEGDASAGAGVGCRLYKSEGAAGKDWEKISLTGLPENALLSQMTGYAGFLYTLTATGELYQSADGQLWSQVAGSPRLRVLLGSIPADKVSGVYVLSGISEMDETLRFVTMNEKMEWQDGNVVPVSFPLSGFCALNYEAMYHSYLAVSGGRAGDHHLSGLTWSTMNGLSWTSVTNEQFAFSGREGAAFFHYDDTLFYLIGGLDVSGTALNDVYSSKDKGVTWRPDTVLRMPGDYTARGFSSVMVDNDNFVLLFGGKAGKDTDVLNELWRGRINRLGFKKD